MSFIKRIKARLRRRYYVIGYGAIQHLQLNASVAANRINWVKYKGYKNNWMADPYILNETDSYIDFLVEEWVEKECKGRLVKISVDRLNCKVLRKHVILDLNTHLSFPNIIRENGEIYICPENAASGKQKIYRFNSLKECLEDPVTIVEEPLLDVSIVKIDNSYYAFGVKLLQNGQGDNCHLRIYKSDNLLGQYNLYQEIDNELAQERGAGSFFWYNGILIRPVQNCEGDYGRNVIFKEITIEDGIFKETVIGGLLPSRKYPEGLHTFNMLNDTFVIDGMGYNVGNWMTRLKSILRK